MAADALAVLTDRDPGMGLLAGLHGRDRNAARAVLEGHEYLAEFPQMVPAPADTGPVIERVLGPGVDPRARGNIEAAANAHYAIFRGGEARQRFEPVDYEHALGKAFDPSPRLKYYGII